MAKKIKILWSNEAKADLKYIYNRILKKTKSYTYAKNVVNDIVNASKQINFVNQYQQVEEFLGESYRRIVVRHFKIIYTTKDNTSIIILEIFDTYRNPDTMR